MLRIGEECKQTRYETDLKACDQYSKSVIKQWTIKRGITSGYQKPTVRFVQMRVMDDSDKGWPANYPWKHDAGWEVLGRGGQSPSGQFSSVHPSWLPLLGRWPPRKSLEDRIIDAEIITYINEPVHSPGHMDCKPFFCYGVGGSLEVFCWNLATPGSVSLPLKDKF